MDKHIAVLAGDGIGPEVMEQALRVLSAIAEKFGHRFSTTTALVGGAAYDKYETHLPEETKSICRSSDAILFGSVGGPVGDMNNPKWKNCEANSILSLRKTFSFNVNYRPVKVIPELEYLCPLKKEVIERGVDILFLRELLGDCYFGEHRTFNAENGVRTATDLITYDEEQIASIAEVAFRAAQKRRGKVTSVDKANVLDASKLWRAVVREVALGYPDVTLEDMLVDNCAMQIVRDPSQFDVVVTGNMFGDILTDAAAVLPGSLGLLASASMNREGFGLYEPPGGSAQDIAGTGTANPVAQILCVALMLRHSFALETEACAIESAVETTLKEGYRTRDIARSGEDNQKIVDTRGMSERILEHLLAITVPSTAACS
ncbi:MAG: 3-isopropylmalate dehydrogenase [Candidatus Melainabacteria bacterium]|jgi:3-isopropylmalate dehydrogenase|nr:3-isopropylmalate dehydrogenase [Candidatus Melainabacteria bacterium]